MRGGYGVYKVTGGFNYRGHETGEVFTARLNNEVARRAIARGVIELVEMKDPSIEAGKLCIAKGWLEE